MANFCLSLLPFLLTYFLSGGLPLACSAKIAPILHPPLPPRTERPTFARDRHTVRGRDVHIQNGGLLPIFSEVSLIMFWEASSGVQTVPLNLSRNLVTDGQPSPVIPCLQSSSFPSATHLSGVGNSLLHERTLRGKISWVGG